MRTKLLARYTLPVNTDLNFDNSKFKEVLILASGTLLTDVTVSPQYVEPDGAFLTIHYNGESVVPNGNKLFILNVDITNHASKKLTFKCFRYGSQWKIITTDFSGEENGPVIVDGGISQEGQVLPQGLADGSVTPPKVEDGAITVEKLSDDNASYPLTFFMDMSLGDAGKQLKFWIDHPFVIKRISYSVLIQADTDSPEIKIKNAYGELFDPITIGRTQTPGQTGTSTGDGTYIPVPYPKGFVWLEAISSNNVGRFLITVTIRRRK